MKAFWLFILALLVAGLFVYTVPQYRQAALNAFSYSQCNTPLPYKIGQIDSKFGLSNAQVLQDLQEATNIWSNAEGKNLFTFSPTAKLTVNFIYDQRAALDSQINQLKSQLSQSNSSLSEQIANYESQVAAFKQKLAAFNQEVEKYNQEGGAPPSVYNDLIKQQNDLNAEGSALNQKAQELNLSTNDYNSNVSILNGDISQFQNELAQKPEEGLYDPTPDTITIYFANNHDELIHTLAHEFGHALGMVHVANNKAIMYAYTNDYLQVTPQDEAQLAFVCRNQSIFIHLLQQSDVWVASQIQIFRQNFVK